MEKSQFIVYSIVMYPEWLREEISILYSSYGLEIRKYLEPVTKRFGRKLSQQEIYDILFDTPNMAPCGKIKRFVSFRDGYAFCNGICPSKLDSKRTKRAATNLSRYGVEHVLQNPEFQKKVQDTNLSRYGVAHTFQNTESRNKAKKTSLSKYGVEHGCQNEEVKEKIRQTNIERYGSENPQQNKAIREKVRQTNINKYGVEHTQQNEVVRAKGRETNLKRYGVEHPLQNEVVRAKGRETNLKRYGVEHPLQNEEIQKKARHTTQARFGVDCASKNDNVKQQIKETNISRYGVENVAQNNEIKQQIKETNISRYGVEHYFKHPDFKEGKKTNSNLKYGTEWPQQKHILPETLEILNNSDMLSSIYEGNSISSICQELGISQRTFARYWYHHGLPSLANMRSGYETEIEKFLSSIGVDFEQNNKTVLGRKHLDFYIPSHKLAIEFNGIYWHSTAVQMDVLYHRKKYEGCRDSGVRLIMINQDEWDEKRHVLKSRILNMLGKSERGHGARTLLIDKISNSLANRFFDDHHIQGGVSSIQYAVGAWDKNCLVGVMAFNQQRTTQAVELIRYATNGKVYAGLFSRLLKHAIRYRNYTEILSFSDLRYSNGEVYIKNGFGLVKEIPPDYRYVYRGKTWHKSSFTKSKIHQKFGLDMSKLTEREAMEKLGIHRIYDCGKLKFRLRNVSKSSES